MAGGHQASESLVDRIYSQLDEKIPIPIFMDLSKASDTIDHEIPITKMEHYGIQNLESKWFKSYLSDRKQYVEFNNTQSVTEIITTGVPQGSILGPLHFLIYIITIIIKLYYRLAVTHIAQANMTVVQITNTTIKILHYISYSVLHAMNIKQPPPVGTYS